MTNFDFLFVKREIKTEEKTHCGVSHDFLGFSRFSPPWKRYVRSLSLIVAIPPVMQPVWSFPHSISKHCTSIQITLWTISHLEKILFNFSIERRGETMVKQTVARSLIVWALLLLLHNASSIQEGRLLFTV